MQAVVLAGGEGSRLRPLTLSVPKPVLLLANRPFLSYMLDWLSGHRVDDVILSCGFLSEAVHSVLGDDYEGMRLRYVVEDEPLGTAGPVRLAHSLGLLEERVLVLNGDVLTDLDLGAQLAWHVAKGAHATLALIGVDDVSSFGVVPTGRDGRVRAFLEKTTGPAPTDRVNAGAYVLERELIERIATDRPVSFEREVFPALTGNGLYGYDADGYWIDIGTPERYLEATRDLVGGRIGGANAGGEHAALIDLDADIDGALVRGGSVVGPGCVVGRNSMLEGCVLHGDVRVGRGCVLSHCIVADGVVVGDGARLQPGALVGRGAIIGPGVQVSAGTHVQPGEELC